MAKSETLSAYVSRRFFQYELMTALYVMEPWEKTLFSKLLNAHPTSPVGNVNAKTFLLFSDTIILTIVSLSVATFYQYTPVMIGKVTTLF